MTLQALIKYLLKVLCWLSFDMLLSVISIDCILSENEKQLGLINQSLKEEKQTRKQLESKLVAAEEELTELRTNNQNLDKVGALLYSTIVPLFCRMLSISMILVKIF